MIPVIINNFNWLSTTKKLVEDLIRLGYDDIHILDNGSTYSPLLEWYKEVQDAVKVKYLNKNVGPRALWDSGYIQKFYHLSWIAYTDSDIELNPDTPKGFIEELIKIAHLKFEPLNMLPNQSFNKVGLSLRIQDFKNLVENKVQKSIFDWERQFWEQHVGWDNLTNSDIYEADIDTTLAVIRPQLLFDYKALRVAGEFTARHIPWYTNFDNLTEEEKYVLDHSNSTVSNYKGNYLRYLKEKEKQEQGD